MDNSALTVSLIIVVLQALVHLGHTRCEPGFSDMRVIEELIDRKVKEGLSRCRACSSWPGISVTHPSPPPPTTPTTTPPPPKSCRGVSSASSKSKTDTGGVFDIDIPGIGRKEISCDTTSDGGGWIVIQRRKDGSVDFYRTWNDYANGFGKPSGEFWIGLETIYILTKSNNYELRIDMTDPKGARYYAQYSNFKVGPASDLYRLSVSGYVGSAGDQFAWYHNGFPFSTRDRDNDAYGGNCAANLGNGGWWYRVCFHSNLNGLYGRKDAHSCKWDKAGGDLFPTFTEMKIRQKQ